MRTAEIQSVRHRRGPVVRGAKQLESKPEPVMLRGRINQLESAPPDQLGSFRGSPSGRQGPRTTVPGGGGCFVQVNGHDALRSAGRCPT